MSNEANWMDKWKRSPRQDRRVVINGKFVEQAPVHVPEAPKEEQSQSALEIVHDPTAVHETVNTGKPVNTISGTEFEEGRYAENEKSEKLQEQLEPLDAVTEHVKGSQTIAEIAEILVPPAIPSGLYKYAEEMEKTAQLLSGAGEVTASTDVLDGQAGRVEEPSEFTPSADEKIASVISGTEPEVTLADVDKAIASIPAPQTYEDYTKTYTVHPGGTVTENKKET